MGYDTIKTEIQDHIGLITFNRPDRLNTFTTTLAIEFNAALDAFENDAGVLAIIVAGEGKAFCAGIDVNELKGKKCLDYYFWGRQMEAMSVRISNMGTPVIASVQDLAVANGIGVVASAGLALAAEGARFGATAVNVGLFCMGPAVALSKNVGRKKALELLLTGDMITAEEAYRIGLINHVVPKEKLFETTLALARKLARKSPLAVKLGKKSFYQMENLDYEKAYEMVNAHFALLCSTEDAHEGVDAFLKKRSPEWKLR